MIGLLGTAVLFVNVPETMAKGHHHHNDGLHLAAGIVNLVKAVITPPAPVVVVPPPAPRPVVVTPPPRPVHHNRPAPPPARPRGGHHR